jgi:hypothetical protein
VSFSPEGVKQLSQEMQLREEEVLV